MFGLFELLDPKAQERRRRWRREEQERRLPLCAPWDPKVKFNKELNFKADTYVTWHLFPEVAPTNLRHPAQIKKQGETYYRLSADGMFMYSSQVIPRGEVPKLAADVALIDIFHSYGGNDFVACPYITRVWCWGSQYVNGSNSRFG